MEQEMSLDHCIS